MHQYYQERIRVLAEIINDVPAAPHISFYHGRHGHETEESLLRLFRYEVEMERWRLVRKLYYKTKKQQRRWKIRNDKVVQDINNITKRDAQEIGKYIKMNRNQFPSTKEVKDFLLDMIKEYTK